MPAHAALHPLHCIDAAANDDIRRLARPRRDRAGPRNDHTQRFADKRRQGVTRPIGKQPAHNATLGNAQGPTQKQKVNEFGKEARSRRINPTQLGELGRKPSLRQGGRPDGNDEFVGHEWSAGASVLRTRVYCIRPPSNRSRNQPAFLTPRRPRPPPWRYRDVLAFVRRSAKNDDIKSPHSSANTPSTTATLWLRCSQSSTLATLRTAPALGSRAPNTSRSIRA